ncbi:cellulose biosynthesis protein BcsQ [Vibrio campbellii]|uniref:cellulose biosynthesis protein BcsQ n=1 Tax=Vibrio campbellii TaxID=680 RepID=UPI0037360056
MKRLLLVSLRGGCGSTTLTANLAQALVKINKQVLAIDALPENLLRLHLGLPSEEQDGWAKRVLNGGPWMEAGYQSPQGVTFLPFGQINDEQHSQFFHAHLHPLQQLAEATLEIDESEQWQLFHGDLSYLSAPNLAGFMASLDMVLVVLNADAINYSVLKNQFQHQHGIQALIEQGKLKFVLNKYQPETEIGRDFMLVLKKELGDALVPVMMHRDTALPECVANLTTVQHYSPISQAAKDYQSLAFWCVSTLSATSA